MFIGAFAGIVLALGVFGALVWQRHDQFSARFDAGRYSSQTSAPSEPAPSVEKTNADARPVYRYSVIPGGVRKPEELLEAMANDPVVAAHYSGIDKAKLTIGRLSEPLKAHVSYRVGDRVYWTKHKVTLQAGEQVLTDGETLVRGRCGNNISVDPLLPTLDNEPKPEVFDSIVAPVPANTLVQLDPAHSYFTPSDLKTPPPAGSGRSPFGNSSIGGGFPGVAPSGHGGTVGTSSAPPGETPTGVPPGGNPPGDPPGGNPPGGDPPGGNPPGGNPPGGNPPGGNPPGGNPPGGNPPGGNPPGGNPPGGNPPGGNPPGGDPPGGDPKGDPPTELPPNEVPNAPTPVPEPGTFLLVGAGAAALLAHRVRRQQR